MAGTPQLLYRITLVRPDMLHCELFPYKVAVRSETWKSGGWRHQIVSGRLRRTAHFCRCFPTISAFRGIV
jgi:hypothetical protein